MNEFFKKIRNVFSFQDSSEIFQFLFLGGLYGLIFLILFFRLNINDIGHKFTLHEAKKTVFRVCLVCWFVFPVLVIAMAYFLKKLSKIGPAREKAFFYPVFIVWNVFFSVFLFDPRELWPFHRLKFSFLFLLIQFAAFCTLKKILSFKLTFEKLEPFWNNPKD